MDRKRKKKEFLIEFKNVSALSCISKHTIRLSIQQLTKEEAFLFVVALLLLRQGSGLMWQAGGMTLSIHDSIYVIPFSLRKLVCYFSLLS